MFLWETYRFLREKNGKIQKLLITSVYTISHSSANGQSPSCLEVPSESGLMAA